MIIADFQIGNKVSKSRYFQETFFMAETKFKVILRKFFLNLVTQTCHLIKKLLRESFYYQQSLTYYQAGLNY